MNWTKIRNEYINGHISYRKLAEKHEIPFQTLRDRAIKEKWFDRRKAHREKISIKTEQKAIDKISDKESDLMAEIHDTANELLEKLKIAVKETDLYIERTRTKVPKRVKDTKTGEIYTAWQEEENIRLTKKNGVNLASVNQIASALKSLQSIGMVGKEQTPQETPQINITISAATPDDIEGDEDAD